MRTIISACVAVLLSWGAAPRVHAQPKPSKKGFATLVVVSGAREWKMAASVLEEVEKNPHGVTTTGLVVEQAAPEDSPEFMRGLLVEIRKARRAIFKLRLKPAIARLNRVLARIKPMLVKAGSTPGMLRRYMQAYNYLGAAYQLDADAEAAATAFRVVLSLDPDRKLKPKYFTAEVIASFNKLKRSVRPTSTLRVETDKPALVFVDGRLRGVAPTVVQGLYPGDHVVELRRLGYVRITRIVSVDAQSGGSLKARVVKDLSQSALRAQLTAVEKALRRAKRPVKALAALATLLKVRQLLVCRASLDDGEATLYDADTKKLIKRVRRISALPGNPPAAAIARALAVASPVIDLQGGPASSGGACEDNDDCPDGYCQSGRCISETPVYKKWWFWTLIGVAVGVVAGGGALLGTMPQRPTLQITLGGR